MNPAQVPHHNNAVNMAKILLKMDVLDADDEDDAGMIDMLWAIINVQNYQINIMNNWLDAKSYAATNLCTAQELFTSIQQGLLACRLARHSA